MQQYPAGVKESLKSSDIFLKIVSEAGQCGARAPGAGQGAGEWDFLQSADLFQLPGQGMALLSHSKGILEV